MELQSSLTEETPVVVLKTGNKASRFLVKEVMAMIKQIQEDTQNGAILLNDLVMKCQDEEHRFFDGCQWKLSTLGFLDTDGLVKPSMKEIILSALVGEGNELGFISPIAS